jgi:hypothetical protein
MASLILTHARASDGVLQTKLGLKLRALTGAFPLCESFVDKQKSRMIAT